MLAHEVNPLSDYANLLLGRRLMSAYCVVSLSLSLISKAMIAPWVWPRTFHNAEYETHELSYTKQSDDAGLLMVTNSMDFTVCPHAHYHYDEASSASTCTNYVAT